MISLKDIGLVENFLTGTLPTELGLLFSNIEVFELSDNEFVGQVLTEFGTMPKLSFLLLQNNRLTGTLPASIVALNSLKFLNVTGNPLEEPLCWSNATYFETGACQAHYPTALYCFCDCHC